MHPACSRRCMHPGPLLSAIATARLGDDGLTRGVKKALHILLRRGAQLLHELVREQAVTLAALKSLSRRQSSVRGQQEVERRQPPLTARCAHKEVFRWCLIPQAARVQQQHTERDSKHSTQSQASACARVVVTKPERHRCVCMRVRVRTCA